MTPDTVVFDVECYRNFFLVLFKRLPDGKIRRFQASPNSALDRDGLQRILRTHQVVGFNSRNYDMPMIQLALAGATTEDLKEASDRIIMQDMKARDFREHYGLEDHNYNHIDLIEVAPLDASLKLYGGRLHVKKLQDLPIAPDATITAETAQALTVYCCNDLDITHALWDELQPQIELRTRLSAEYKQDLRSKSDAQLAEHILTAEIAKLSGNRPKRPTIEEGRAYKYHVPDYIRYHAPELNDLLDRIRNADFRVNAKGSIEMPEALVKNPDVKIAGRKYRIGIGGLHSQETRVGHVADENNLLIDRDVASFYPRIILSLGLFPQHLGEDFLKVYNTIVDRRLMNKDRAKEIKNILKKMNPQDAALALEMAECIANAESLKISINGTFGKLGSKYSALYSPDLLVQVTVTGQLSLLMLIEMLERKYINVISANTDGILIRCAPAMRDKLQAVISEWERATGFETEETLYRAVYSKDVNNYLAIKEDGSVKGKGLYANPWEAEGRNIFKLHKNPSTTIVIEAVVAQLRDDIPVAQTIRACKDVRKFIAVRAVTGGATMKGEYIGKALRWYYADDCRGQALNYKKATKRGTHNKVPKSDGAKPLMELPDELPTDINYDWYIAEARNVLNNVGYTQGSLFEAA